MVNFGNDWDEVLKGEFDKEYYKALRAFLIEEYRRTQVFPNMFDIFNALKYTPYSEVKAVIIGQDPYHGEGQAHGLCFSVKRGVTPPPSLKNIFTEMKNDLGLEPPGCGELTPWAGQGVLLLNSVLTVRAHQAGSHAKHGWETFTDRVIAELDRKTTPVVFLLWGAYAGNKAAIIQNPIHVKLRCAHPSPLSAYNGFFGCRHFSRTNEILTQNGMTPIDWRLE